MESVQPVIRPFWQNRLFLTFLLIVLVVAACAVFFIHLNVYPMQNWDEGVHAQVTQEMLSTGDYWSLHYQGGDYFRKPPLKIWLTAPLVSLFGDANWTFRFWSAVGGLLTTLLLTYFVYTKNKQPIFALLTGFVFVSGQYILYHSFRTGEMDGLLVFLVTAGVFAYWRGKKDSHWLIAMGMLFGLALMAKSLAGLIGPFIVILDSVVTKNWRIYRTPGLWWGVVAFLVVVVPWHVSMLLEHGKAFWDEYIGFHIVERTFGQLYADLPWWWYGKMFLSRFFPFGFFALAGSMFILWKSIRSKVKDSLFVVVWLLVPILLFTFVKTKFEWYLLPMYPAAAWLAVHAFRKIYEHVANFFYLFVGIVLAFFTVALIPNAIIPGSKTYWFAPQVYLPDSLPLFFSNQYVVAVIVIALILVMTFFLERKYLIAPQVVIIIFICYASLFAYGRNLGIVLTQPTESVYENINQLLKEESITHVYTYETDFYGKPAGYFELSRSGIAISDVATVPTLSSQEALITSGDLVGDQLSSVSRFDQYYVYTTN